MPAFVFRKMMADSYIREDIITELLQNDKIKIKKKYELSEVLEHTEKEQFRQFRSGKITLDQLKARIAERRFGCKYLTMDDLRQKAGFDET